MFYLLKNNDGGNVGYTEKVNVAAGTYKLGAVLTATGAIASGAVVGAFVNMEGGKDGKVLSAAGSLVCTAITDGMVFEVAKPGTVTVGKSYGFKNDGTGINTTEATTGGAQVLEIDDDKVRVKINK